MCCMLTYVSAKKYFLSRGRECHVLYINLFRAERIKIPITGIFWEKINSVGLRNGFCTVLFFRELFHFLA